MADEYEDYRSYLLRLWRVQADGHAWRASLENVHTREVRSFASMEELIAYLDAIAVEQPPVPQEPEKSKQDGQDIQDKS